MRYALALLLLLGCGASPDPGPEDASTTLPDGAMCPSGTRTCPGVVGCRPLYDFHNCGACGVSCTASAPDCVMTSTGYACR